MKTATLRTSSSVVLRGLGSLALLSVLAGCSFGNMQMSGPASATGTLHLQGRAFGGEQPISGSVIEVWAAGKTGYGQGAAFDALWGFFHPHNAEMLETLKTSFEGRTIAQETPRG